MSHHFHPPLTVQTRVTRGLPLQWPPVLAIFFLTRMAELINGGLDIESGIRDKSLEQICKGVLLFCGTKVDLQSSHEVEI